MLDSILNIRYKALLLLALFGLSSCSNRDDYNGFDGSISLATPDSYFEFFNQHSKLPAGKYSIIAATSTAGVSADFELTIIKNDGSAAQVINGSWSNSAGPSNTPWATCSGSPANVCTDLTLNDASGVTIELNSTADSVLYLVTTHNSPVILSEVDDGLSAEQETIQYTETVIQETEYSQAYYQAVDATNARDTLQKYQTLHGFGGSDEVHVTFRDSKDLGYGRDMYMRSYYSADCGGQQVTAFYVRNFSVDIIEGLSYGLVNLEAAISEDLTYHFGSNAIEFSKGFDSLGETCADEPYTRFFTYKSDYSTVNADHNRLDQVDLDGRGEKAMPQPCISCHGGKARPLDRFGRFITTNANDSVNQIGDTKSRLQAFEVDTFQFSNVSGKTQSDFEEGLRQLNSAVFCTYPGSLGHAACADYGGGLAAQTDNGEWNGDFAREMMLGAYGGNLEVANTPYQEGFVPAGWVPTVGVTPEGADTLFTKVVGPNCFVCHGKRGSALGAERNLLANRDGKDIDFSTWTKFISHAEEIKRLVFEQGRMPLGLLNYENFWGDPEKAELLAAFIAPHVSDFSRHVDSNNNVLRPGAAVARAGLDRVTQINEAITLNASASLFVNQYSWLVTDSPSGSVINLTEQDQAMTDFSADTNGTYVIELTVTNTETNSTDTDELIVNVDNTLAVAPRDLTFYGDIQADLSGCLNCHSSTGLLTETTAVGIPVWWSDDGLQPIAIPTSTADSPSLGLYEQVKSRVNLNDIEDSLILKKPSNNHHFGGLRSGFNTSQPVGSSGRAAYDKIVNWISEGAVCAGTTAQCPDEE